MPLSGAASIECDKNDNQHDFKFANPFTRTILRVCEIVVVVFRQYRVFDQPISQPSAGQISQQIDLRVNHSLTGLTDELISCL